MNRLRATRKQLGLSQQEVTLKARVSIATLTLIERYDHVPTAPVRARIAEALGVSESSLWPDLPGGANG